MSPRKQVSEKSLELNLCAELIQCIRAHRGCEGAVWFGMTQQQERRTGLDEATANAPGQSLMLQFKSPYATSTHDHYKFSINRQQHEALENLAIGNSKAVYYVFPLYSKWRKILDHSPNLTKDTWLVPVSCISLNPPPSQDSYQIDLRLNGSQIEMSGPNLQAKCGAINARSYCIDAQDQSLNPREVGIPSETLKNWVKEWQDPQLRFRGLNAVYLPRPSNSRA